MRLAVHSGTRASRRKLWLMHEDRKQTLAILGLLIVLFCAFFWAGFFLGRSVGTETGSAAAGQEEPQTERLRLNLTYL